MYIKYLSKAQDAQICTLSKWVNIFCYISALPSNKNSCVVGGELITSSTAKPKWIHFTFLLTQQTILKKF